MDENKREEELKRIKEWIEDRRRLKDEESRKLKEDTSDMEEPAEPDTDEKDESETGFQSNNQPDGFDEWPEYVRACWTREMNAYQRYAKDDKQGLAIRRYLEWIMRVPWKKESVKPLNLWAAKEILDSEHFGMDKVKQMFMEILAVKELKKDSKCPVILLSGPPGVGKSSFAKSVAKAMGRRFEKVSLGGMTDEIVLKGSDRAYNNSFPGAIIKALCSCGTNAPVILLDEIDKLPVGSNKGDCSSIFLEILDSDRSRFIDNYLYLPFDLSDVLFICTANDEKMIARPLLDRMETIYLPGYTKEEKFEITKRYIIPKTLRESGLKGFEYTFGDDAIRFLVDCCYASEGARELERHVSAVCRRIAFYHLSEQMADKNITSEFIIGHGILQNNNNPKEKKAGFYFDVER